MINYLARLGWASGDKEKFTIEELIHLFNLEKLNKSSSIFDYKKLYNINKYFIKESEVYDLYKEFLYISNEFEVLGEEKILEIIDAQRDRCKTIREIADESKFFISDNLQIDEKLRDKFITKDNLPIFDYLLKSLENQNNWTLEAVNDLVENAMVDLGLKLPEFAKPVRVLLTGSLSSPSIDKTMFLLGKKSCIQRIGVAKSLVT